MGIRPVISRMNSRVIFFLVLVAIAFATPMIPPSLVAPRYHTGNEGAPCYGEGQCNDGYWCDLKGFVRNRPGSSGQCKRDCTSSKQCGSGRMCNFDYGRSGFCESCRYFKSLSDCKATRFITRKGKEECYDVCAYNQGWKYA